MKNKCIICGNDLDDNLLMKFTNMPASAQDIPDKDQIADEKEINLELFQCGKCGLVQFGGKAVSYYKDVIRSGGYSTTMVELRRAQYKKFIELCNLEKKKIIEVGCGQGEFLSVLTEFDVEAFGIENKQSLVDLARDKGLNVKKGFAENKDSIIEGAPYDAFLSFNFLEHQPDPNGMLEAIYNNLTEDGFGLITVPSLEYILQYDGYYELIKDHIAYYTFDTLSFLLEKNGFTVLSKDMVNRDTLEIIVRKRKKVDISKIQGSYQNIISEVDNFIDNYKNNGKKVAIWGASHQGFTLASTANLGTKVEYIIDSAPFKQGKYSPGSHIPIISPDDYSKNPVDVIIIIAPGYTDEIKNIIQTKYGMHIEILTLRSEHLEKL